MWYNGGMIDSIIKWSGWIIALGLAIWEIYKYVRNRYKVKVNISLGSIQKGVRKNRVVIEVKNSGRRPIHLTFAGFHFEKGPIVASNEMNIELGWVYKELPSYSFVELRVMKELVEFFKEKYSVEADGICFVDESGDKHIGYFPEDLRQILYS